MPVRWAGAASLIAGLVCLGVAFPALASAHTPSITDTTSCATAGDGSWDATFTVHNDPNASYGDANISQTGTGLDGKTVTAGGGAQQITLHEAANVASVTVSGKLTWPKDNYHAPFSDTANKPSGCSNDTANVTLCHATNSNTNPYEVITVDAAGAYDGHLGHTGPVWNATLKDQHISWGDIIPPFSYQGQDYSLNWPGGQAIWDNGCNAGTAETQTVTSTVTNTVTEPGPTVTVTGPTTTVTETVPVTETQTATVTEPGPTTTIPGPTTTVIVPGPTVTLTETATATTTEPGPTVTVTQTVAGEVSTVTETVTVTPPTVTVTPEASTVTSTVTVTESAAVAGTSTSAAPAAVKTVTVTKFNCPPGSAVQGGSLAYTGSGDATMAMIGGALTAGGAVCLLMGRKRRAARAH